MKWIKAVDEPMGFPAGTVLALTEKQAFSRKLALEQVKKGIFKTSAPVQFKVGEIIGVEGDLPKGIKNFELQEKPKE